MSTSSASDHPNQALTEVELKAKKKALKKAAKQSAKDQANRQREMGVRCRK